MVTGNWILGSSHGREGQINGRTQRTKPKNSGLPAPKGTLSPVKRKQALTHNGHVGAPCSRKLGRKRKNTVTAHTASGAAGAHSSTTRPAPARQVIYRNLGEVERPRAPRSLRELLRVLGTRSGSPLRSGFLLCPFNGLDSFPTAIYLTLLISFLELARKDKEESVTGQAAVAEPPHALPGWVSQIFWVSSL